jgi:hypothetical protein
MRLALALAAVVATSGTLPKAGVLVPGRSLGGVRLGETAAQVRASLGRFFGVCASCTRTTWYFTYARWEQRGLAVELDGGDRVSAVYTLWQPPGWRTLGGLRLGAAESQVTRRIGSLVPIACRSYDALVRDVQAARTVYYVVSGKLWGFGLMAARADPCR